MKIDNFIAFTVLLWIWAAGSFIVNAFKLVCCDFEAPFKEEIIHAIGIIVPPASIITCWF